MLHFCFSGERIPHIEYTKEEIETWDAVYGKVGSSTMYSTIQGWYQPLQYFIVHGWYLYKLQYKVGTNQQCIYCIV